MITSRTSKRAPKTALKNSKSKKVVKEKPIPKKPSKPSKPTAKASTTAKKEQKKPPMSEKKKPVKKNSTEQPTAQKKAAPKPSRSATIAGAPIAKPQTSPKPKKQVTNPALASLIEMSSGPSQMRVTKIQPEEYVESDKVEKKIKTVTAATIGPLNMHPLQEEAGEEYMSKRQLQYFQDILEAWRDQLHAERNATVQHMQEDPINFPDLLDRAALEEEHKLEWQAREREHKLIIKIEKALARIKQGDYGYCEKCGSEIGLMRLQVRPTATLCIDCKAIDEIRERQTGVVE